MLDTTMTIEEASYIVWVDLLGTEEYTPYGFSGYPDARTFQVQQLDCGLDALMTGDVLFQQRTPSGVAAVAVVTREGEQS
jgi:hypothetical protein